MSKDPAGREGPAVSIVLPTRDRPRLLQIALACYRQQTYPQCELIVVDDGDRYPVDERAVAEVGGRLLRVEPGTLLGTKLNVGLEAARGPLCLKMDDDDWYAPEFLSTMVSNLRAKSTKVCRPAIAFLMPFLLFDLPRWELRRSIENQIPGGTLLFAREDWHERPFRPLAIDEDLWFVLDQARSGVLSLPIWQPESYLAVRHRTGGQERGHVWDRQANGRPLQEWVESRPLYPRRPENVLPAWALSAYRELRAEAAEARRPLRRQERPQATRDPSVLILTPVKDAADCLDRYCQQLAGLTYPHDHVSLGFLESDSADGTYEALERRLPALREQFRRVDLWKRDFGDRVPDGLRRDAESIQIARRTVLARSRNHLLFHALKDEDWVLWLDVDVLGYPRDVIQRLLATGKDIVQPHCVPEHGGPTFGGGRSPRAEADLLELDAVGGTMLLVNADVHRDGLIFPAFPYGRQSPLIRETGGEVETEGLGIMAHDMGFECWGMPQLEVLHRRD